MNRSNSAGKTNGRRAGAKQQGAWAPLTLGAALVGVLPAGTWAQSVLVHPADVRAPNGGDDPAGGILPGRSAVFGPFLAQDDAEPIGNAAAPGRNDATVDDRFGSEAGTALPGADPVSTAAADPSATLDQSPGLWAAAAGGEAGSSGGDPVVDGATRSAMDADVAARDQAQATPWTLNQLIDRAVRQNPRVLAQRAGGDVARAAEAAARWEYFPNPQVQVEGTPHDHQITATVTQPIYAFGRLGSGLASARAQGRVARMRLGEARHDVALRVLEIYGQFVTLSREIAVLDSDIERHLALEAMIHRRVEAGVSAPVDLNLVQTRLNQSRITRTQLKSRQRVTLAALSQVVGVPLTAGQLLVPPRPAGDGPAAGPAPLTAVDEQGFLFDQAGNDNLLRQCLDHSPSLQRAEAELAAAQAEARRARSVVFPTIAAKFENRSRTSLYPASGLPDTRLTIGFTIATGAGLASLANIRAADGRIRAAEETRTALRQDITTSVIGAIESFVAARKSVEGLRDSQAVQQQTAESYNRMFLAGKRSWLDLLNMVREQSGIERDLADAEVQLMVADYRLRIEAGEIA